MNPDNPFSSGSGKTTQDAVRPEQASVEPQVEAEAVQPVRAAAPARAAAAIASGELPALEMDETSCRTCQFFHFDGDARVAVAEGECRFNAPSPGLDERAQWPIVEWDSWCGQWNTGISNDDMVKMARVVAERMTGPGSLTD